MYRLLLVDDEALIREGVGENVPWGELGYELAASCENGRQAWDYICTHPVDVVMTDICMPFMDGMELSSLIRRDFPHIKVLLLSGYDEFEYAKSAIKYGVEEYILKPVTSCELGDILIELGKKLDREREEERKRNEVYAAYRRGKQLLCTDALINVITGRKSEEECVKELGEAGIELNGPDYLVGVAGLSLYIGDYELEEEGKKESSLMAFIVYNLSQEIVNRYHGGEVCQGRDNRVFILFETDRPEEFHDTVRVICREIIDKVREVMNMGLNIALGEYQRGIGNIYRSYEKAEKVLLQQYCAGDGCIMEAGNGLDRVDCGPQVERVTDNLIRHIRECDHVRLKSDHKELEEYLCSGGYRRREAVDVLLGIRDKVEKLLRTLGVDGLPDSGETDEAIRRSPFLAQAMTVLREYNSSAVTCLKQSGGNGSKSCAYEAMSYIEEHFGDSDLSLQGVCTWLGISTSRFSSVFKQTFGVTFMDALIGLRMQKAKELLAMTEFKTYEIAERVGFSDPHYFSIAFKKVTGKTPTEYARERKG